LVTLSLTWFVPGVELGCKVHPMADRDETHPALIHLFTSQNKKSQKPEQRQIALGGDEPLNHPQSQFRDTSQISRGKFNRFLRTAAGFTTSTPDGYGLRGYLSSPVL
jgi:hypothetical protein